MAEYVPRVRTMTHTYLRGGHGRVLWLTPSVPRDPRRVPIFAAVDRGDEAVRRAGATVATRCAVV